MGDIAALFPKGIASLDDLPHTMFNAIRVGLVFLSYDELPKDEKPPRRIWTDMDKMTEWFAEVERKRDERYDSDAIRKPIDGEVTENEAAKGLIVGG